MEYLILYTTDTATRDIAFWTAGNATQAKQEFAKFLANYRGIPENWIYILGVYLEVK